jgi:hypothetical protein
MKTYYTHARGLEFFLEMTGMAFEGHYLFKISNVAEQALESMAEAGGESWIWDEPREVPRNMVN